MPRSNQNKLQEKEWEEKILKMSINVERMTFNYADFSSHIFITK